LKKVTLSLLFFSWLSLPPNSPLHLHSIFYTLVLVGRRKGNLQSTASYLGREQRSRRVGAQENGGREDMRSRSF